MTHSSKELETVRQHEITKRTAIICATVTSGIFIISTVVAIVSGQWADFAKKQAEAARDSHKD